MCDDRVDTFHDATRCELLKIHQQHAPCIINQQQPRGATKSLQNEDTAAYITPALLLMEQLLTTRNTQLITTLNTHYNGGCFHGGCRGNEF